VVGRAAKGVRKQVADSATADDDDSLVVVGSGNLGLVYAKSDTRMTKEDIEARWPALIPGLTGHAGIGFIAMMSADGPVAIGREGTHWLADGRIEGVDPMALFGEHAAGNLHAAVLMERSPDLYVNSLVDPSNNEVAAFEPLVGCHGGLGGWQDRGMLIMPSDLMPDHQIKGADQMHQLLVSTLERLGHRGPGRPGYRGDKAAVEG
jgi:hypothetical protein